MLTVQKGKFGEIVNLLVALLLALFMGGIMFSISGYNPFQVYFLIAKGAFGGLNNILTTLTYAIPLVLSGLAFSIAKKANIMNLGGEGQIYVGAMAAALVGAYVTGLPSFLLVPLALLVSFVAAGIYGGFAVFLKVRHGSNVVITTLMLNYIAQLFCGYLVSYPLRGGESVPQTKQIAAEARLGRIIPSHQLSTALLVAIATALILWVLLNKTRLGYQIRVVGYIQQAAETAGINYKRVALVSMFISAGIAGLCGATQVLGTHFRFIDNFSSGYGFEGIAVAALAANNPLMILFSGLLFGGIKSGAMSVNRVATIPMDYITIIQALVVVFIASPKLVQTLIEILKVKKKEVRDGIHISNG